MSISKSDEDAAGVPSSIGSRARMMMDTVMNELKTQQQQVSILPICVPDVVTYDVDGRVFSLSRQLLEKDPQSLLYVLAEQHYGGEPKRRRGECDSSLSGDDDKVIRVVGKSADTFERLVNFLRGYKHALMNDWKATCEKDVDFYGLQHSWTSCFEMVPKSFTPFHMEGTSLHCDHVCATAGEVMRHGTQVLDLMLYGDYIGVGIIAHTNEASAPDGMTYGILYWTDGAIRTYSEEDNLQRSVGFDKEGNKAAEVRITFDVEESMVRWERVSMKGRWCVGLRRAPSGNDYKFGVLASPGSRVFIKPSG